MFGNPWMMCFDVPWQPYYASAKSEPTDVQVSAIPFEVRLDLGKP